MKEIIINKKIFYLSLEYILGLFEGDGSIYVQLKPNSSHKTGHFKLGYTSTCYWCRFITCYKYLF